MKFRKLAPRSAFVCHIDSGTVAQRRCYVFRQSGRCSLAPHLFLFQSDSLRICQFRSISDSHPNLFHFPSMPCSAIPFRQSNCIANSVRSGRFHLSVAAADRRYCRSYCHRFGYHDSAGAPFLQHIPSGTRLICLSEKLKKIFISLFSKPLLSLEHRRRY